MEQDITARRLNLNRRRFLSRLGLGIGGVTLGSWVLTGCSADKARPGNNIRTGDQTFINAVFAEKLPVEWINYNASFTVTDALNFSGAGGIASYIYVNEGVLSERCRIEVIARYNKIENGSYGIQIGFKSYNEYGYDQSYKCGFCADASDANFGCIEMSHETPQTNEYSTGRNTDVSDGDVFKFTLRRVLKKYYFTVENQTKKWVLSYETPGIQAQFATNSSYPAIYHRGGDISVVTYKYIEEIPAGMDMCIIGDSITYGEAATTEPKRWASQVGSLENNIVMGGGADYTASVLKRLNEIMFIKPRRALLMIGGNDLLFYTAPEYVSENLRTIRNTLVQQDIEVIHLYPTPRLHAGMLINIIDSIDDLKTDKKIDTNTPLQALPGSTDLLNLLYDSGDKLHPNSAGHLKMAQTINAALNIG